MTDEQLQAMANPPQRGGGGAGRQRRQGAAANAPVPAKLPGQLCGGMLPAPQAARGDSRLRHSRTFRPSETSFTSMKVSWRWSARPARNGVAGGTVFVQSGGNSGVNDPPVPAQVALAAEHYGMLMRNVEKGVPVSLEMNIENKFYDDDLNSFNVIGEIAGTDKAGEVVMVGAHFDSWHTGTGATDNAPDRRSCSKR